MPHVYLQHPLYGSTKCWWSMFTICFACNDDTLIPAVLLVISDCMDGTWIPQVLLAIHGVYFHPVVALYMYTVGFADTIRCLA